MQTMSLKYIKIQVQFHYSCISSPLRKLLQGTGCVVISSQYPSSELDAQMTAALTNKIW